jgi:hypothetical protein
MPEEFGVWVGLWKLATGRMLLSLHYENNLVGKFPKWNAIQITTTTTTTTTT